MRPVSKIRETRLCPFFFFYNFIMCDCTLSMLEVYFSLNHGTAGAGEWSINRAGWRCYTAADDRKIFTLNLTDEPPMEERILELIKCLAMTVSPEVSRSRRFVQRKINGFPCCV